MTLALPTFDGTNAQFIFDLIAQEFPLHAQDIANDAITADQIAADAVGSSEIASGAVGAGELATGIVLQLNTTGTARKVAFGTKSVTFPNAKVSTVQSVTHGLASTPVLVLATPTVTSGGRHDTSASVDSVGATTFNLYGVVAEDVNTTDTLSIYWLAIG